MTPRRSNPVHFGHSLVRDLRNRLRFALVGLILLVGLHVLAMMALEGMSLGSAIWLTFTTITTTGFGDYAPRTGAGRAVTIVLLYLSGIFLMTQAASAFFGLRLLRRQRMRRGEWRWNMRDHIVFVNAPAEQPAEYLRRLVDQLRRTHSGFAGIQALVLTEAFPEGLPADLEDDPLLVQVKGRFDDPEALEAAGVQAARVVVILAEREGERLSDSRAFDIIHRLREIGVTARIIAECVDDRNRDRLKRAGANAVVRPLRGYPEMIVRAIVAPGAERIIERLFGSQGDECLRFEVTVEGLTWAHLVCTVLEANFGTPIGYVDAAGHLHTNPAPQLAVLARALFILVDDAQHPSPASIQAELDRVKRLDLRAP
jgi:voltage-gated potassium channel